ncbi:MAG TPA: MFS transporter [Acidimicrobiales bacterium]|nr:MFS transporter [Acidimicrobiales bacterium]
MSVDDLLDEAPTSRFHHKAVIVSGVGFFTDAYDLFVISTVATLVATQWHLSTTETSWVSGSAILGAFFGAVIFGRIADLLGRKRVYAMVAAIMILGAVASAVAPGFAWLVVARFVLGLGIGGDYPVSAVLMSEYANRVDRGRLVGLVFSMQALGLVVGPLASLALLGLGIGDAATWRVLLGLGAVPAAAVLYLRTRMPESPRFTAHVRGDAERAAADAATFSDGVVGARPVLSSRPRTRRARDLVTDTRLLRLVIGTAGSWFLFDYAYYGNTLSLPAILAKVDVHATLVAKLVWTLGMFVAFAVPGYALAVWKMDTFGHRKLQLLGFSVLALSFLLLAAVPALTSDVAPFLLVLGVSYFFVEFGPNTTTFVLPSELFPTELRTTGHGIAAGVGKLGAFAGVFVVPQLEVHIGLRGMLVVAGSAALLGLAVTRLLPEPSGRGLADVAAQGTTPSDIRGPVAGAAARR